MNKCIWCLKSAPFVKFGTIAHIIPSSLQGKKSFHCNNVCQECNNLFGAVESGFSELMRISLNLLAKDRNLQIKKYKSDIFNIDAKFTKISIKPGKIIKHGFEKELIRKFKRTIYKIFLEFHEKCNPGESLDPKYDFIRDFAKNNIGDLPVFYFERNPLMIIRDKWITDPSLIFSEAVFKYLDRNDDVFEFELFGHIFSIPFIINYDYEKSLKNKNVVTLGNFKNVKLITKCNDIDWCFSNFN